MPDDNKKREITLNIIKNVKLHDAGVTRKKICLDSPTCNSTINKIDYPNLYLNIKQAPELGDSEVDETVTLMIDGKIISHSKNDRVGEDSRETFDIEIKKIGVLPKPKKK